MAKALHWLTWSVAPRAKNRPPKPFQLRDGVAAWQLAPLLHAEGYAPGEVILQPPYMEEEVPPAALREVEYDFVKRGDLLLQATRPPMDDHLEGNKKKILAAFTTFEAKVFDAWREVFERCARSHVILDADLGKALAKGHAGLREVKFRQYEDIALCRELNAHDRAGNRKVSGPHRTLAFLMRVEEAWKDGPGLVGAFAMDGTATLVWAYRLARDFRELLAKPGIVLAELRNTGVPKYPQTDLSWAEQWEIDIVLHREP